MNKRNYINMEKNKQSKSIIVEGELHNRFKVMCRGKSLKIGGVIEDLIRLYLNNPKTTQKIIDELKENDKLK